jgi:hypothetical protein
MKTTIELSDGLFKQAKASARAQGMSFKALIEPGQWHEAANQSAMGSAS